MATAKQTMRKTKFFICLEIFSVFRDIQGWRRQRRKLFTTRRCGRSLISSHYNARTFTSSSPTRQHVFFLFSMSKYSPLSMQEKRFLFLIWKTSLINIIFLWHLCFTVEAAGSLGQFYILLSLSLWYACFRQHPHNAPSKGKKKSQTQGLRRVTAQMMCAQTHKEKSVAEGRRRMIPPNRPLWLGPCQIFLLWMCGGGLPFVLVTFLIYISKQEMCDQSAPKSFLQIWGRKRRRREKEKLQFVQ